MQRNSPLILRQEAASRVVKRVTGMSPSRTDLVYSKESFKAAFDTALSEESELSDADFDLLLLYLSRDCGAIAYDGKVPLYIPLWPCRTTHMLITNRRSGSDPPTMPPVKSPSKIPLLPRSRRLRRA